MQISFSSNGEILFELEAATFAEARALADDPRYSFLDSNIH